MDCLVKNGTNENLDDTCPNDKPLSSEATADEKKSSVTFPKYRYNRDELLALRGARRSRMKPTKLSKEFELEDQKWDPDKWFYSIDRSADTQMPKPEKPSTKIPRTYNAEENVYDSKKSGGDFKRTLISSIGDSDNIVLGPQRNSFTTGCNASRTTTKRDVSPRRDGKERSHRIGSGRVQVSERRPEKLDYEPNERRGGGVGATGKGFYDNEWKDDRYRRGDRRDGNTRTWTNQRDRSSEGLHRSDHRFAMGSRSHTEATSRGRAAEPEWFTRGPSSRNDVIELRGFGMRSDDGDVEAEKSEFSKVTNVAGSGDSIQKKTEAEMAKESSFAGKKRNASSAYSESSQENSNQTSLGEAGTQMRASVASEEADNSGGCSADGKTDAAGRGKAQEFDFNDFFKDGALKLIEPESVHEGSSRFQAFFNLQPSSRSTDNEGQHSSLLERFPTLNAIVDGHSQSPLPASPPIYGHRLVGSDEAQEKKRFLMMLEKANLLPNEDAKSTYFDEGKQKEFTADLKGILKVTPSADNARAEPQTVGHKVLPSGSKPLLAEELEANLLTDVNSKKFEQNLPHRPATSLPMGSKVTTLAELEGGLMASKDGSQPKGHADNPDMSAFNKLLDFVHGVGKPSDQMTMNSSSQGAVFTAANSDLPSTLLKTIEQHGVSALDEPSGCPSLAMSLAGHQVRIQNRPVSPVTSSPIMFGSQPPTNLMMPQARRQIQQGQPAVPGVGFVVRPSHTAQRNVFVPDGTAVVGRPLVGPALALPSVAASGKLGGQENWSPPRQGQYLPDAGRSNGTLVTDASVTDANAKQRTEAGKVSQSFTPTVVMRKMISERAASRNAGDKTNILASDQLSQDMMDGTASNESRYSNPLTASGASHVTTAGLSASSEATSAAMSMNSQQAMALQQNQILQMIKNHLSLSSNSLPPHQQMVDGASSHASRGYVPSMGFPAQQQFLNYPTGTQMVGGGVDQLASARWPATGNRHALDIMAQLRGQGQGQGKAAAAPAGSGYLPYRSVTGGSSSQQQQQQQQQQHSMLAPADMAAILLQRLQSSTGQPMPGAKPPTNLPIGNTAPPPIGRAIVKGTGLQPQTSQTNQTSPLATIQAMMLQQQHQHSAPIAYPGMPGPGALVPGAADHWNPAQATSGSVNSVHMNGGTGIHGNSSASLSNGNYDSANLSRLFGESFLRHPQVASMPSFQGHKTAAAATMMTVDDLERRYALGASSARLS